MGAVAWARAIERYSMPRRLSTRARHRSFTVQAVADALVIVPGSGHARTVARREFERALALIDRSGRGPLQQTTFNSSYIEAIADDLRRAP